MSSIACDDGLFRILASRKLVSFAAVIGVVSGGEALRDEPNNSYGGDRQNFHSFSTVKFR